MCSVCYKSTHMNKQETPKPTAAVPAPSPEPSVAPPEPAPAPSPAAASTSHAEGLRLLRADNKAGYFGVYHNPGKPKPATLAARDTIKMSEPEAGLLA